LHAHAEQDLNRAAVSATTHCLTGCAIGEVLGMAIATIAGWGNLVSIVLAIGLAFFLARPPLTCPKRVMTLGQTPSQWREATCPVPGT